MEEYDEIPDNTDIEDLSDRIDELEQQIEDLRNEGSGGIVAIGYTMGMALAITLSWFRNGRILWCIVHGICSWLYVIYFAFTGGR